jgi:hypothetical protein
LIEGLDGVAACFLRPSVNGFDRGEVAEDDGALLVRLGWQAVSWTVLRSCGVYLDQLHQ